MNHRLVLRTKKLINGYPYDDGPGEVYHGLVWPEWDTWYVEHYVDILRFAYLFNPQGEYQLDWSEDRYEMSLLWLIKIKDWREPQTNQ